MILYWMSECLPVAAVSIMPVALYPLFGITSSKCVSQIYFNVCIFMYILLLTNMLLNHIICLSKDIQALFFGGKKSIYLFLNSKLMFKFILCYNNAALAVAIGIESSGLHEKLALKIIMLFGSDPKWLMLGVMCVTSFLSLWIQNPAVASMMLRFVMALVKQVIRFNRVYSNQAERKEINYAFYSIHHHI
mgnify:CR=1 FL=1